MKGNAIVLTSPYGQKKEGVIDGTPKPGTCMQIKTATAVDSGGRHTFTTYSPVTGGSPSLTGDGAPSLILLLQEDNSQGFSFDTAYVSGKRGSCWAPLPGDEVNVRKADISGTGSATEDLAIGDRLLIVGGTGMISKVAVGIIASPVSYPFQAMESLVDQPAETLVWCIVTGQ